MKVYDRITQELYDFARIHAFGSSRDKHEIEDLIQEMLVCFYMVAHKYPLMGGEEFLVVAKTAARNRVRDFFRKKRVRVESPAHFSMAERVGRIDLGKLDCALILESIKIRLRKREIFVLDRLVEGGTPAEICAEAGLSRASFYRSRDRIRSLLR